MGSGASGPAEGVDGGSMGKRAAVATILGARQEHNDRNTTAQRSLLATIVHGNLACDGWFDLMMGGFRKTAARPSLCCPV